MDDLDWWLVQQHASISAVAAEAISTAGPVCRQANNIYIWEKATGYKSGMH